MALAKTSATYSYYFLKYFSQFSGITFPFYAHKENIRKNCNPFFKINFKKHFHSSARKFSWGTQGDSRMILSLLLRGTLLDFTGEGGGVMHCLHPTLYKSTYNVVTLLKANGEYLIYKRVFFPYVHTM